MPDAFDLFAIIGVIDREIRWGVKHQLRSNRSDEGLPGGIILGWFRFVDGTHLVVEAPASVSCDLEKHYLDNAFCVVRLDGSKFKIVVPYVGKANA